MADKDESRSKKVQKSKEEEPFKMPKFKKDSGSVPAFVADPKARPDRDKF